MDVHAPHEPIHSAKDFFLHLVTITIGLLIALGLEGLVEMRHHHELLHQAEANLSAELRDNRAALAKDEEQLAANQQVLTSNIQILQAARDGHRAASEPSLRWYWNGMQTAAWDTARNTGAIALMDYDHAQAYSIIYGQQTYVDNQASLYIRDIYRSETPLQGGRKLADLTPAQIDTMIAGTQQTLSDIQLLTDLCHSLDKIYSNSNDL